MNQKKRTALRTLVKSRFKTVKGEPFILTDGQCDLFWGFLNKDWKWVWESAPSRYGKTEVAALALIYLAAYRNLKLPIVAGSKNKAEKIMEYVTQHIPDHPELYQGLLNADIKNVDRLKVEMSKNALRWSVGGWIYVTSIESRSLTKEGEGVVGEGGDLVTIEEAGLIKHKEQLSKIIRMAEGEWRKIVMLGNCVEKSVFEDAYNNPRYHKIRIGLDQAVAEGRYTEQELVEKKEQTTTKDWKRYYLVEFPKAGEFSYFKPKAYEYLPNELKYFGALDPALGESAKGSLIGVVILGRSENGQVYEIESHGLTDGPEHAMQFILNLPYKFERFGVEGVMFQRYYKNQMEAKSKELGKYIPFETIEQKQNKLVRIESTEPIVNTGQVLFKKDSLLWSHMQEYPDIDKLDVLRYV
jgi:hypothetical protein